MAHSMDKRLTAIYDPLELRSNALQYISVFICIVAYGWLQGVFARRVRFSVDLVMPAMLALGATLALFLRKQHMATATYILIAALGSGTVGSVWLYGPKVTPYLVIPTVVFAGVLLDPIPMLITSALVGAGLIGMHGLWNRGALLSPALLPLLAVIAVTAFASWLSSHNLYTALRWALENYAQALEKAKEAQERRGHLRQVLQSMDEASSRLQRINFELARARDGAEELRRLKQQFVTGISHELRTPLSLIAGFAETMYLSPQSYGVPLPPEYVGDVREIYRNSQHLISLIDDILDLSRISAGKMILTRQEVEPGSVIREAIEAVRPLIEGKGLALELAIPDRLPTASLDPTRVRQVLINLLNNARRFTERGTIRVEAQYSAAALHVSVRDTGVGIPPAHQARLFDEFQRLDAYLSPEYEGQGLGLAISKEFVEMHGGRIWVESEGIPGKGSVFRFTLPLQQQGATGAPLVDTGHPIPHSRPASVLLLVGDAVHLMAMLKRRLADFKLVEAETFERIPQLVARLSPLAILISPMPGCEEEQLRTIQSHLADKSIPVILFPFVGEALLARSLGVQAYLTKPVRRERLLQVLTSLGPSVRRVLIVDDDPRSVQLISRLIHAVDDASVGDHYEVLRAFGGEDGLQRLQVGSVDAIILDLIMPGMDGLAFLAAMRQQEAFCHIPVIVLTAQELGEESGRSMAGQFITISQRHGISNEESLVYLKGVLEVLQSTELLVASQAT